MAGRAPRLHPRGPAWVRGAALPLFFGGQFLARLAAREVRAASLPRNATREQVIETGERAPDFELPDQDGGTVKLSNFQGQCPGPGVRGYSVIEEVAKEHDDGLKVPSITVPHDETFDSVALFALGEGSLSAPPQA